MNEKTLLLRQVHPSFMQDGQITSQVFRPTPKDENKLSVYDGDMIAPEASHEHFCRHANCTSCGVMAISQEECNSQDLSVREERNPYPEHCTIDFSTLSKGQIEKKAKLLKRFAENRGWLFCAESAI